MLVVDSKSNLVIAKMAYWTKSQWETTHILLKSERKRGGNELQDKCKMNVANLAKQRNSESEKAISLDIWIKMLRNKRKEQ